MTDAAPKDAIHSEPVWRERADFIISARLPEPGRSEQLWARSLGDNRYEICCIPFFVFDLALGDIVETNDNHDFVAVVERSGRFVFRVWFGDSFHPRHDIAKELSELGALLEWSSVNLLAVDASDAAHAQGIADHLAQWESDGVLQYETGRSD